MALRGGLQPQTTAPRPSALTTLLSSRAWLDKQGSLVEIASEDDGRRLSLTCHLGLTRTHSDRALMPHWIYKTSSSVTLCDSLPCHRHSSWSTGLWEGLRALLVIRSGSERAQAGSGQCPVWWANRGVMPPRSLPLPLQNTVLS